MATAGGDDNKGATDDGERNLGEHNPKKVTFLSLVTSTLKAAIGVSDREARERDFQHHSIAPFIAAGVIFTVLFVLGVVLVVKLVLPG